MHSFCQHYVKVYTFARCCVCHLLSGKTALVSGIPEPLGVDEAYLASVLSLFRFGASSAYGGRSCLEHPSRQDDCLTCFPIPWRVSQRYSWTSVTVKAFCSFLPPGSARNR